MPSSAWSASVASQPSTSRGRSTPVFVQYVNDRLEGAPELRDLGPEGMEFIPAKDSPSREPLLILTSEVSNTVSVYSLVDDDRR